MDPDMVRQQEEAEAASRLGRSPAARAAIAPRNIQDEPIVLRGEPRGAGRTEAHEPSRPAARPGWVTALRAAFWCLVMTAAGLIAGIMLGVKLGLIPEQKFAIGVGLGFLLGWQAAAASLRGGAAVSFGRALRAPILPTLTILVALIAGMFAAFHLTGLSPETIAQRDLPDFWLIVGAAGLIGFLLAAARLRKTIGRGQA
jgi:hypothetical protein